MRVVVILLLLLGACSQEQDRAQTKAGPAAPAPVSVPAAQPAVQPVEGQSAMRSVPTDPAALKKLQAMGYTVHDDHLHAPGVAACPKMSDDPVM